MTRPAGRLARPAPRSIGLGARHCLQPGTNSACRGQSRHLPRPARCRTATSIVGRSSGTNPHSLMLSRRAARGGVNDSCHRRPVIEASIAFLLAKGLHMGTIIGILITFLVIVLVLYLINMLPIDG